MSFVVGEAAGCVRDFLRLSEGCSASLPLVTDPWHCTLLQGAAVPVVFIWLELGSDSIQLQEGSEYLTWRELVTSVYKYRVMSALRKHQNTGICLGLMALGKDFYIKKAVAKIAAFLVPVFLQACSSACSELALEVGVTVHEVGCKHHMAACFSGKTLR